LSIWIERYGLSPEDAASILDDMLSPTTGTNCRSVWDLMGDLAQRVNELLNHRRRQAEAAERARKPAGALSGAEIAKGLAASWSSNGESRP
jgi:hypothetical protein